MKLHIMKWLQVALSLAAASAFAIAVQAGVWWSVGEVTIGPFGARHCFGGDCPLKLFGTSDLWLRSAVATGAAGALSSFLLVVLAGALAAGRTPRLLARVTLVSIACAIACGVYFFVKFPGIDGAHVDRGVVIFAGAIVVGIAACVMVLRAARAAR